MNKFSRLLFALSLLGILTAACSVGCGNGSAIQGDREIAGQTEMPDSAGHPDHPGHAAHASSDVADWCAEHRVPESVCTKCNPALIDNFKATGDWCGGHDLPESHCRLCNPGISFPQEAALAALSPELPEDVIEVTLAFRSNAKSCATNDALIRFASERTAERAGLTVLQTRSADLESALEAPAEVAFDENHATVVSSTVPALVSRWLVSPGMVVAEGDPLAELQSAEVADLQARLISAAAAHASAGAEMNRHRELRERGLISAADYEREAARGEQARAEYVSTRGRLLSAGMSDEDVDRVEKSGQVSHRFTLYSPAPGLVVERIAALGDLLEAGRAFARLADPAAMWIEAQLTEAQLRRVKVGQTLTFASDGHGLSRAGAKVVWVSRFLDPHTRTGTVRAEVVDRRHHLQAGEFGRVTLVNREAGQVVLVPRDAVQWEGCCNVVFVRESLDRYRPRKVELAAGSGPYYQVLNGLSAGEEVVVGGAFLLKTELTKTSIGAGCCGLEPTS